MDCEVIQLELVSYHFGAVDEDVRRHVEEHLVTCSGCLRDYLALKREIETASTKEKPSTAAKERLRRAVIQEIRSAREPRAAWPWWQRTFAVGLAGATLWAAMFAMHLIATSPGAAPHSLSAEADLDQER